MTYPQIYQAKSVIQAFTSNGDASGSVAVTSTTGFVKGCYVWINASGLAAVQAQIIDIPDATHLTLVKVNDFIASSGQPSYGPPNLTGYTTVASATLNQPVQILPQLQGVGPVPTVAIT